MPVFIMMIHVEPGIYNPKALDIAGAYVNCLIEAETFISAEDIALKYLKAEFWIPIAIEESYVVTEDDFADNQYGRDAYRQVLVEKQKYMFHIYL